MKLEISLTLGLTSIGERIVSLLETIMTQNAETKQLLEDLHAKAVQADAKTDLILAEQQRTVAAVQGLTGDIDGLKGTIAALQDYINTMTAEDPELKALADKAAATLASVSSKLDAIATGATSIADTTTALDAATPAG